MKKKNGFTLIELLAVIIILGVIMLIAIPSVTQQITNSRKNSYIDTASSYISAVVVKVNEGQLPMFDTDRLYLIPVGNNAELSCVGLESGGASPFHKEYDYAYVAVRYTGDSYDYWFLAQDKSKQGFAITETKKLEKATKDLVLSGMNNISTLITSYSVEDDDGIKAGTGFETCEDNGSTCKGDTNPSSTNFSALRPPTDEGIGQLSTKGPQEFANLVKSLGVTSIQVFGAEECRDAFK